MSVVARFLNENEAALVRSLLESYDIPVTISSDHLVMAVYPMNVGEVRVSVPDEHRDEALQIIEAHRSGQDATEDATEP